MRRWVSLQVGELSRRIRRGFDSGTDDDDHDYDHHSDDHDRSHGPEPSARPPLIVRNCDVGQCVLYDCEGRTIVLSPEEEAERAKMEALCFWDGPLLPSGKEKYLDGSS